MGKFKLILALSLMSLFIALILLIIVIYNFNNSETGINISSYPQGALSIPQSFPISYNTSGTTHYIRADGLYAFDYSNKFKLVRDKNGTQILKAIDYINVENFNPQVTIYSQPLSGYTLEEVIEGHLDYVILGEINVNNNKGIIYRQTIDKYEDIYYSIIKGDLAVTISFRKWTNFDNNYQSLDYLSNDVLDIVNSIVIN